MMFRQKSLEEPDLNLTPLIDVVFLLLIFFMVSTTFNKSSELSIDLPESSGKVVESKAFIVEISLDQQGRIFINEKRLVNAKMRTLKRAIQLTVKDHKDPQIVISADKNTPYQFIIKTMDAIRQLGLSNMTFATKQATDPE